MFKDEKSHGEPPRPDLSKPTLYGLSYLLRNLPEGFQFNYHSCPNCAMGLAAHQWEPAKRMQVSASDMERMFGLDSVTTLKIFHNAGSPSNYFKPRASEIADLIDAIGTPGFEALTSMNSIMMMSF